MVVVRIQVWRYRIRDDTTRHYLRPPFRSIQFPLDPMDDGVPIGQVFDAAQVYRVVYMGIDHSTRRVLDRQSRYGPT